MAQFFRRRWPGVSYGRGEDWHYVGEAGEPAFTADWENVGIQDLAFRKRESDVIDLMGTVGPTGAWASTVFTLPVGYRPSGSTYFTADGDNISGPTVVSAIHGVVNADGTVQLAKTTSATVDRVFINTQIFLVPATSA